MVNLSIPYALHTPSGSRRDPASPQDGIGRKANVSCLGCEEQLEHRRHSRNGRRAYYAHLRNSDADATSCAESAIHMRTKDMLSAMSGDTLDIPLPIRHWGDSPFDFTPVTGEIEVPVGAGNRKADVVWENAIGQRLAIEVWYSNRKGNEVVSDYRRANLPTLELRVSHEDGHITTDALRHRLMDAKWLVKPKDPFASANPPLTRFSDETCTMLSKGFRPAHGPMERLVWSCNCVTWKNTKGGLTCWISNYSSARLEVGIDGLWRLSPTSLKDFSLSEGLDIGASLFRDVQQELRRPSQPLTKLKEHYHKTNKGNWTSASAVPGLRITVFREYLGGFKFCVMGSGWKVYGNAVNDRIYRTPGEARQDAERLASKLRNLRIGRR